jgi:hypothetical protein
MLIKKSNNFNYRLHGTLVAFTHLSNTYHSTFAASTLIILFSEMLKISDFFFWERTKFVKENIESSGILYLLKWKFQILINFEIFISTNIIFLKIQYFPSQFYLRKKLCEKLNISENNIISIEAGKVVV